MHLGSVAKSATTNEQTRLCDLALCRSNLKKPISPTNRRAHPRRRMDWAGSVHTELETIMDDVTLAGIDLGKHSFHLHGQDAKGKAVFRKRPSRKQLIGQRQAARPPSDNFLGRSAGVIVAV
jgi:hypothetical protein